MRYLRIFALIALVASLAFSIWANIQYNKGLNTDLPELTSTVDVLEISVQDGPEAIFRGLAARDDTDGDLTAQIMVASVSHFLEPNTVNVKYVVFDSHHNSASLTRRVCYTDYTPPRFTMDKAPIYTVGKSFDLLEHVRVEDCIDGDISERIRVISNMVNNYAVGVYPVILEASNSCGDTAQITIWVTYAARENTADIKLHQYIVYIEEGEAFDPYKWIASVTGPNTQPLDAEKIEIQGNLDTQTPGIYKLTYSYSDATCSGQSAITVVVTERGAA